MVSRNFREKINERYGDVFTEPDPSSGMKFDFFNALFRQIERVGIAGSMNDQTAYVNSIDHLEIMLSHVRREKTNKWYGEKIRAYHNMLHAHLEKQSSLSHASADAMSNNINQMSMIMHYKLAQRKMAWLMVLMEKAGYLPKGDVII